MKFSLLSDGLVFPVEVEESAGRVQIRIDGQPLPIDIGSEGAGSLLSLIMGGQSYEAQVRVEERRIVVELDGERFAFELADTASRARKGRSPAAAGQAEEVRAPMPGKVVKVLVAPGDAVEAGQGLLLFEAMKMQNEIRSPVAGRVLQVKALEGQTVESRDLLLTLQG